MCGSGTWRDREDWLHESDAGLAKSCGVFSSIHEQSGDINRGVERADPYEQGAGDQGMMFGYIMRLRIICLWRWTYLFYSLLWEFVKIRKEEPDLMPYLRPDAKSQVTIEYDDNGKPLRIADADGGIHAQAMGLSVRSFHRRKRMRLCKRGSP